ncbi:steroid 3-ketoacyl-CoA thiolase [Dactylosporangium roseum]|uniref:Steroid 3-ketoacyl-CoA thiolase n=1 Tax=Dactylosporangium roseum TaxID=47989 RepID=A0ABY5YXD8_9ACTN|nr:steroid 3-ketoacyl-CoA thiolase [Dactylosporangium roseum]UWZ34418.1 steroid 3-ketoacyl-CoA thiolase [Dactylosporangium roseum]
MANAVIVEAVRSPMTKRGKELAGVHPAELLGQVLTALFGRTGVDPARVEQLFCGCVTQSGEQASNVGRTAWLAAGLPTTTAATVVNCACSSSQQANHIVAGLIEAGVIDVGVACGVESMSRVPLLGNRIAGVHAHRPPGWTIDMPDQFAAAERIARHRGFGRDALDEFAVHSHRKALRAWAEGRFDREVVPVTVSTVDGPVQVTRDGIPRPTDRSTLAGLDPVRPESLHTAATSAPVSDGASAVLWMRDDLAVASGLRPRARIVSQVMVGADPFFHLDGPVAATSAVLDRAGMTIGDIDLFEINEAFAAVPLSWAGVHRPDLDRLNVNGGGLALGHPVGATGARLIATALHELERRDASTALVSMCAGSALASATIIERR